MAGAGWRGKPEKREAKRGWKPGRGERFQGLRRHWKKLALLVGIAACLAVAWVLITFLRRPEPARLLIVGADPAKIAPLLDVPLDLHGWQGGRLLAQVLDKEKGRDQFQVVPDPAAPPLQCHPEALASQLAKTLDDPSVQKPFPTLIYFGLLGAADDKGAFLFGPSGQRVLVKDLVKALAAVADQKNRTVILIFDAARVAMIPEQGLFHNTFVEQLEKDLQGQLSANVIVLSSSSKNEIAWNNETRGCSAFLVHLIDALQGGTRRYAQSFFQYDFPVHDLVRYVTEETVNWTKARKIAPQTPCVIHGVDLQNREIQLRRVSSGLREDRWTTWHQRQDRDVRKLLNPYWDFQDRVAGQRPGPEAYTPLQWQRYRALLRRYEAAVCTEHGDTVRQELALQLDALRRAIELKPLEEMKPLEDSNRVWGELLAQPADPARAASTSDVEGHLVHKLDTFWKALKTPLEPAALQEVARVRHLAERAALACPESSRNKAYAYSERLWTAQTGNQAKLLDLDARRRLAEDLLFTKDQPQGLSELKQLATDYQALLKTCELQQTALATYHAALRDVVPLASWHLYCAEVIDSRAETPESRVRKTAERAKKFKELAAAIHELGQTIHKNLETSERNDKQLKDAGELVDNGLRDQRQQFHLFLTGLKTTDLTPEGWLSYEMALAFAWPGHQGGQDFSGKRRGDLLLAFLKIQQDIEQGHGTTASQAAWKLADFVPARTDFLASVLIAVSLKPGETLPTHPAELAHRWRHLLDDYWALDPRERTKADLEAKLKPFDTVSRVAWYMPLPPPARPGQPVRRTPEPAEQLRDVQWARVLHGHARRLCRDHWFKSTDQPFSYPLARNYVAVGNKIADGRFNPDALAEDEITRFVNSTNVLKLAGDVEKVSWTSELRREFTWKVSGELPRLRDDRTEGDVGHVALFAQAEGQMPFLAGDHPDPQSVPLRTAPQSRAFPFHLTGDLSPALKTCTLRPVAYFRGRETGGSLEVLNQSRPNLIVTEQAPTGDPSFTISSERPLGIGVGRLVVLIDYSKSMDDPGQNGKTRMINAIDKLEELFNHLPSGVEVTIRIFSDNQSTLPEYRPEGNEDDNQAVARITKLLPSWRHTNGTIFKDGSSPPLFVGDTYVSGTVVKEGNVEPRLPSFTLKDGKTVKSIMDNLREVVKPAQLTPLIQSMETCFKQDVLAIPGANSESTVMLVLTDGADTSMGRVSKGTDPNIEEKQKKLRAIFKEAKCSLRIVLFNEKDDDERKNAEKQISCVTTFTNPSSYVIASNSDQLIEQLKDALKPRVVVTEMVRTGEGYREGQTISAGKDKYFLILPDASLRPIQVYAKAVAPGRYQFTMWGSPVHQAKTMQLDPGDHVFVKVEQGTGNSVEFKRGLFSELWKQTDGRRKPAGLSKDEGDWQLTVPEVQPFGDISKTPHVWVTLESARERFSNGVLQMHQPNVWWDVKSSDAEGKAVTAMPATVHITRKTPYYAPTWQLDFHDAGDKPKDHVRVQAFAKPGTSGTPLSTVPGDDVITQKGFQVQGSGPLRVQVVQEEHALFENGRPASKRAACIVVRLENTQGKRYVIDLTGAEFTRKDHQYYDDAQAVTALFQTSNDLRNRPLKLFVHEIGGKPLIETLAPMTDRVAAPPPPSPRQGSNP